MKRLSRRQLRTLISEAVTPSTAAGLAGDLEDALNSLQKHLDRYPDAESPGAVEIDDALQKIWAVKDALRRMSSNSRRHRGRRS